MIEEHVACAGADQLVEYHVAQLGPNRRRTHTIGLGPSLGLGLGRSPDLGPSLCLGAIGPNVGPNVGERLQLEGAEHVLRAQPRRVVGRNEPRNRPAGVRLGLGLGAGAGVGLGLGFGLGLGLGLGFGFGLGSGRLRRRELCCDLARCWRARGQVGRLALGARAHLNQ